MDERLIKIVNNAALDAPLADWAAERLKSLGLPSSNAWGECTCAGIYREGLLVAVCVYHGYQPYFGQVQMSLVADSPVWCNRGVLKTLLGYPFQNGLNRIWVITRDDNKRMIRLLKWIGFVREGTMGSFFGPRINAISWRLLASDYQAWLKRIGRDVWRQGIGAKSPVDGAAAAGTERIQCL